MALNVVLAGNLIATDDATGTLQVNKVLSAAFAGTLITDAETLSVAVGPVTIALPISPTHVVYIKNLDTVKTVTVVWTRTGGSSASVVVLQPLAMILLIESNTTSGITALSLAASSGTANVDYILAG